MLFLLEAVETIPSLVPFLHSELHWDGWWIPATGLAGHLSLSGAPLDFNAI